MKDRLRRTMMFVPGNNPSMMADAYLYGIRMAWAVSRSTEIGIAVRQLRVSYVTWVSVAPMSVTITRTESYIICHDGTSMITQSSK